ncbi:hypothetical protein Enr13x_07080 [Stieleria neptunia]|uniref:Uncharacterized protein n=1 Tax=Stieleria neptunia TaxID=2527979 RepID=A0A518HJ64_9BACT|nr:hypothetical protein [Stieleria neptunia]QDV40872.1 hypothetical protein Enr13x_07080 [Stieleria neptunia]
MSKSLKTAIQSVPDWRSMTPADLLAALNAVKHEKKPESDRRWSIAGISRVFGAEVGEAVYQAILAAGLTGNAARFAALGLDATDPQWLAMADQLIAAPELAKLPDATKQQLKWIGHTESRLWSDPITRDDVQTAQADLIAAEARYAAYASIVARANAAVGVAELALKANATPAKIRSDAEAAWNAV